MLRNSGGRPTIGVVSSPKQVARRSPRPNKRRTSRWAIIVGILSVLAGFGLMFFIASLAGSGDIELNLGDEIFEVGQVNRMTKAIAEDGPFLIADASPNRTRDIFLQHIGNDPENGWLAFAARADGTTRKCTLQWDPSKQDFVDPCSNTRYPPDGKGLTGYIVKVRDSKLYVDLRIPESTSTSTSSKSTTSTSIEP